MLDFKSPTHSRLSGWLLVSSLSLSLSTFSSCSFLSVLNAFGAVYYNTVEVLLPYRVYFAYFPDMDKIVLWKSVKTDPVPQE